MCHFRVSKSKSKEAVPDKVLCRQQTREDDQEEKEEKGRYLSWKRMETDGNGSDDDLDLASSADLRSPTSRAPTVPGLGVPPTDCFRGGGLPGAGQQVVTSSDAGTIAALRPISCSPQSSTGAGKVSRRNSGNTKE